LISWTWLADYVDLDGQTPETLASILTNLGLEVEGIRRPQGNLDAVFLGRVTAVRPHPKADRLRLATVDVGSHGTHEVVCGAPNVAEGIQVPVALEGATLPNGLTVKKAKIRGVESRGMLCSESELGISDDHSGLMVLEGGAPGMPVLEYLGTAAPDRLPSPHQVVFELSITPNRGDCLSHVGVAAEIAAL